MLANRPKNIMIKLSLLLTIPLLTFTSCNNEGNEQTSKLPRYSTQTFTVAGMTVITQITDNETSKMYFYQMSDKKGLTLKDSIDLTKCGDQNIPFEKTSTDVNTKKK